MVSKYHFKKPYCVHIRIVDGLLWDVIPIFVVIHRIVHTICANVHICSRERDKNYGWKDVTIDDDDDYDDELSVMLVLFFFCFFFRHTSQNQTMWNRMNREVVFIALALASFCFVSCCCFCRHYFTSKISTTKSSWYMLHAIMYVGSLPTD